ncbi:hypothetical protein AAG596_15475 [Citromicrobium bathyomarinum]|uniref:hypothetical protein n=1 Tax=Citromicrobium bathyomarinum TaxID=72174 RepID=UPI003159BEAE|tara:strand:+ start:664 stop:840 length:177 start_codon:yes stop_codon:yes gene_type:complete
MGFIIDAAAHSASAFGPTSMCCNINQMIYLAEIKFFRIIVKTHGLLCRPVVDGVDSQA